MSASNITVVSATDTSPLVNYKINQSIGEGQYIQVFRATRISDGLVVAIKKIRIFEMSSTDRKEQVNEADILSAMHHPHIIQCYDAFFEGNELYLIIEYADYGDISRLIDEIRTNNMRFGEVDMWRFLYCVSSGLAHMHSKRIMHRDIKPANIYINQQGEIKVGDLGLGRVLTSSTMNAASLVGTPYYMSPELIKGDRYSFASDIWSLGCLVYELAMLQVPFVTESNNLYALGQKIIHGVYQELDDNYSTHLKDVVNAMLLLDPNRRPTAQDISSLSLHMLQQMNTASILSQRVRDEGSNDGTPATTITSVEGNPFLAYEDLGVVGRGKYSSVHKARNRSTGAIVAVKKVQIFDMDSQSRYETTNEAHILQSLPDHPNIIRYLQSFIYENDLYLILELAECGDLGNLIESRRKEGGRMKESEIWFYFLQICEALGMMHSRRIMHRDIKPTNIFLTSTGHIKVGDLGLGRYLSSKTYETFSAVGTPFYMSPEAISMTGYSFKSDIWSLGCLLYEMTMLYSPFHSAHSNFYTLGNRIKACVYDSISPEYSVTLSGLINSMIREKVEERPDITQVIEVARYAVNAFNNGQVPNLKILPNNSRSAISNGMYSSNSNSTNSMSSSSISSPSSSISTSSTNSTNNSSTNRVGITINPSSSPPLLNHLPHSNITPRMNSPTSDHYNNSNATTPISQQRNGSNHSSRTTPSNSRSASTMR